MSQSRNLIIRLLIICIASLAITYIISVNIDIKFCRPNWSFLSNNFLSAIFSGIFASTMVVLITESLKFRNLKKSTENLLFNSLATIYGQMKIAENNIQHFTLNVQEVVPDNIFQYLFDTIYKERSIMRSIDFNPLFKNTKTKTVEKILKQLFSNQLFDLATLASDTTYLPLAINADKSTEIIKGNLNPVITSSYYHTHKTLAALQKEILQHKNLLLKEITELNTVFDNRFHWNEIEHNISNIEYPNTSLETFWKQLKV